MTYKQNQLGTVTRLKLGNGYGFIQPDDRGPDLFFHVDHLLPALPFDITLQERRVRFDLVQTDRGPAARNVAAE